MPNAVIERLESQRAEQVAFVDSMLSRTDAEGRDLVEAETNNLTAARQRIEEIDAQLAPLREFENLRGDAAAGARAAFNPPTAGGPRPAGGAHTSPQFIYRSAGQFLRDYVAARDFPGYPASPDAAARLAEAGRQLAALQNQTTPDTPGLLPEPIVGPVVNTLDTSRPFVSSIGAKPLGNIAGTGFNRPKITQHVQVGPQAAEKTELPSRKMTIAGVPFTKGTYGGAVDISRQDIDWTSPSAWDALVSDLAAVYGAQTDLVAAADFATRVLQTEAATESTLEGWALALYNAAVKAYRGGAAPGEIPNGRLPNHIWVSLDMWAAMGSIVDVARLIVPGSPGGALGEGGGINSFAGNLLNAPRTVVPTLPDGTIIVGSTDMYEFYEDQIGLLSAVEPKLLGVEVAYGGYVAYGMLEALNFCKVTAPPVVPLGTRTTTTASK